MKQGIANEAGNLKLETKTRFDSIVEQKIKEAMNAGKFQNIPGHGKPLKLSVDSHIPEELRTSYKILKNAGVVPKEIELNAEIRRVEDLISGMTDVADKFKAMKKLNFLKTKILKSKGSTAIFNIPETYEDKVVERVERPTVNGKYKNL